MMNYDEDPIIVTTAHTFDELKAFQKFNNRNKRSFMLILLPAIVLVTGTRIFDLPLIETVVFLCIFAVVFFAVSGLIYTRDQYKRATKTLGSGLTFHFKNDYFDVINECPEHASQGHVPYEYIYRVHEEHDMLYIYIGKEKAFLVSMAGLQNHSPNDLRSLLKKKTSAQAYRIK